ncbi:uncharacterized protein TRAVEDRAFT_46696 [Trametes versicolor FP-101664 SS1]|uniref:uncharacterized protein n=1 Tax=Trametes versicolor (strain FP-101664) TaxID=717944 RepID=UPI00046248C8|nr:uncharacterized protein TRAVEDRAFT_46696 [Trametes versicolor FP-101664 SS1]EIW59387.1 hypothetical protein TRAVEDRAFT_46696 [Trametes versicolor FP-101664 SS1]
MDACAWQPNTLDDDSTLNKRLFPEPFSDFTEVCAGIPAEDTILFDGDAPLRLRSSEVESGTQEINKHHLTNISSLGAIRNSVLTIYHLPTEILSYILLTTGRAWASTKAIRMLHVCRHWRSILMQTSEFWADMLALRGTAFTNNKRELVNILLARSGCQPLRLTYPPREFIFGVPNLAVAPTLAAHLHRVTDLLLSNGLSTSDIQSLADGRFSGLNTLDLTYAWMCSGNRVPSLTREDQCAVETAFPRLRHLTIPSMLFPYFSVQSVQQLYIRKPLCGKGPRPQDILDGLTRCSEPLRSLNIDQCVLPDKWPSCTVPFPVLTELTLEDSSSERIASFLRLACLPPTTHIAIHCPQPDYITPAHERLRHLLPESISATFVDAADELRIHHRAASEPAVQWVSPARWWYEVGIQTYQGARELLAVTFASLIATEVAPDRPRPVTYLPRLFSGVHSITTLRLDHYVAGPGDSPAIFKLVDALPLLATFPRLVCLSLGPPRGDVQYERFIRALAATEPSSGGLVCPALEELAVVRDGHDAKLDIEIEAARGGPAACIAAALEERQKRLGRPLRSFVVSLLPLGNACCPVPADVSQRKRPCEYDEKLLEKVRVLYTGRLSNCVENISAAWFRP